MNQLNFHNQKQTFSTPQLIPLLHKAKNLYLLWYSYYKIIPKEHRYTLGQKVDKFLLEIIEAISIANFLKREEKLPYVRLAIRKTDILKIFLLILWETKSLDNSKYIQISEKLSEIGKMLGGWNGNLNSPKQNSSNKSEEK
ncbi:MAG: four helix bundle protein [Candidatus Gribaldobacteria bacterium]|nr:four helix bundle protein [Candidatus Gribaldobacteria bacterium]